MDVIPASLAIAQAAKETGWGNIKVCLRGECPIWSMDVDRQDGITPLNADEWLNT